MRAFNYSYQFIFLIDCKKDRVTLISYSSDGKFLEKEDLCGNGLTSNEKNIDSNRVVIEFETDNIVNDEGFLFSYQAIKDKSKFLSIHY